MELNGNGAYALELQGVNHHYGTRQILFDLNLKLPPNRIYGPVGPERRRQNHADKPDQRTDISEFWQNRRQ